MECKSRNFELLWRISCRLHVFCVSVQNIQRHLAAVIPKEDQILLLGPPYKVPKDHFLRSPDILDALHLGDLEDDPTRPINAIDSVHTNSNLMLRKPILATTEKSGSRRLFLFSKQTLTESAPDPLPCSLKPLDLDLPTKPDPSPILYNDSTQATSPLHQALSIYERRFMLHVCQGKAYADGSDLRLQSARNCVMEQAVMIRALRAAVSNLSDHWNNATRTRAEFTTLYVQKMNEHGKILNGIDEILDDLSHISLHQELKAIARINGRVMETLLDTVPVERERKWASQCQTAYTTLQGHFEELKLEFDDLTTSSNREEEAHFDLGAEGMVKTLDMEVEDIMVKISDCQADRLQSLTEDHKKVVSLVLNALQDDGRVQATFTTLESMSKASAEILPSMEKDDLQLKNVMVKVADAKTKAMIRMNIRLRQISQAQRKIQRVLKTVSGLRAALSQQCENMTHVEHLVKLPIAYRDFLTEIGRRLEYGEAITSISKAMFDRLASMRIEEVKAREKFLHGSGRHLMPSFFEIFVPTLATQPPMFTPQLPAMGEFDSLPRLQACEQDSFTAQPRDNDTPVQGNINADTTQEASSLTESLPQYDVDKEDTVGSSISKDTAGSASVIISVAGQSGGDIIMDKSNTIQNELMKAREDYERVKRQLDQTNAALVEIKKDKELGKICDKISHSSFCVGDVALFMPTGRGSGGKRTYLAFHSNCPHRYLSTDSIAGNPDYVLGRVVYQEELVAGAIGTDANPHGLISGTKFWILTVEVLKLH